jgi:hypothetical protein
MHLLLSLLVLFSTPDPAPDDPHGLDARAIKAACKKAAAPARVEPREATLRDVSQVFVGKLKAVGALRRAAECTEGAVLEVTFEVEEILFDEIETLTKGAVTVVLTTRGPLGDVLLAGEGHALGRPPRACLDKLGLPCRLKTGRRYLVAGAMPWEGEQAVVDIRRVNSEVRKTYGTLIREAGYLETFKAAFGLTDDHLVNDEGDHFEIIVTHPSTDNATGGAEQYLMDKKTGKWRMGWHEHPMPMRMDPVLDRIEKGDTK